MRDTTVILNQFAFQEVAPTIMLDQGQIAWGHVRQRSTTLGEEFIIDHWELHDQSFSGQDYPPLMDYAILTRLPQASLQLQSLNHKIQPKRSHRVVCLGIDQDDHSVLPVGIWTSSGFHRPVEIRFIGPKLITLPTREVSTDQSDLRSSRTRGALREVYDQLTSLSTIPEKHQPMRSLTVPPDWHSLGTVQLCQSDSQSQVLLKQHVTEN